MSSALKPVMATANGLYYGTTRGKSWWSRYLKDGFFSRGNCEIAIDESGLHFRRYLTSEAKDIPWHKVIAVEVGRGHAGKWTGAPVIKIVWKESEQVLVSGFSVSYRSEEARRWVEAITAILNARSR
jgi:uncharacterized protein (UPF0248 family)